MNLAELMLSIDSARQYGLIEGGPEIDARRCRQLLHFGLARGITPDKAAVAQALALAISEQASC